MFRGRTLFPQQEAICPENKCLIDKYYTFPFLKHSEDGFLSYLQNIVLKVPWLQSWRCQKVSKHKEKILA